MPSSAVDSVGPSTEPRFRQYPVQIHAKLAFLPESTACGQPNTVMVNMLRSRLLLVRKSPVPTHIGLPCTEVFMGRPGGGHDPRAPFNHHLCCRALTCFLGGFVRFLCWTSMLTWSRLRTIAFMLSRKCPSGSAQARQQRCCVICAAVVKKMLGVR